MRKLLSVLIVAGVVTAGCGKSEAEKQAEQSKAAVEKAAQQMQEAAKAVQAGGADAQKGMADMAKAMQGMAAAASGSPDGKPVDPVSTDVLKSALPQISGWEMRAPKSQRMTSPVAFSETETRYKKGDMEIELKLTDTGYAQMLVAPWTIMMANGFSRETDDGYEKSTTVGGNPGFETWRKDSKHGELNIFVNKRFMVTIEGRGLENTKALHDFAANVDFSKVAGMK